MIRASIDMGSNTVRMLVAEITVNRIQKALCYQHYITRLGQGLHNTNLLSQEAMSRTTQAIQLFKQHIQSLGVMEICATATSAVRQAKNGRFFLQQLKKETGIEVQLISEQCEAELCLHGIMTVFPQSDFLLFDIGGGSTEFSRVKNQQLLDTQSYPLGVVEITEKLCQSDPPTPFDYDRMTQNINTTLHRVEQGWTKKFHPKYLVGTAGTVTTLAALHLQLTTYDAQKVNGQRISFKVLQQLKHNLYALNYQQRCALPALEKGRADLIIAGIAIVEQIMKRWQYPSFICVDAGLLEGSILLGKQALQPYLD